MMDYTKTATKAKSLLSTFGTSMTLNVTSAGTYDPVSGVETGATVTGYDCVGVVLDIAQRYVDGERVLQGDKVATINGNLGVTPRPGDTITIGGETWNVVNVMSVAPAGSTVIYKLQVRHG